MNPTQSLDRRRAGVLLHITSLPGRGETGDLGSEAYHFVDFVKKSGLTIWQMLPIGPTQADGSPYQSSSVHAGNPRLIGIEPLVAAGWLEADACIESTISDEQKQALLKQAWNGFRERAGEDQWSAFELFKAENSYWLEDYTLFRALHASFNHICWWKWPQPLRTRQPEALEQARKQFAELIEYISFEQHLFFSQWNSLKGYANERGVLLFGDMPIFVAHDSAEVWASPEMFLLDDEGLPTVVAGVPPDYFSELGQRWGNPLYNWDHIQADGFGFWIDRLRTQLRLFDLIRIDHFRGFEANWEIPAHEEHAINGSWVKVPGDALFERLHELYDPLPLVAEDLGIITPEVDALRNKYELPGMKVLQFAFSGGADNPYLPFRHERNSVVYTGTHDNDTTLGWYRELDNGLRQHIDEYLGQSTEAMPWRLIRAAMASRSKLAVVPMQDWLGLGTEHRMNLPGTTEGNWLWRFSWEQLEEKLPEKIHQLISMYGRI